LLLYRGVLDGIEDLLDDFRVQRRAAMERHHYTAAALRVRLPLDRNQTNADFSSNVSASAAVRRGSLGMNFDRCGQDLLTQRRRALLLGQSLQEKLNCFADVGQSLFDRLALRLAALQLRAPCVIPVLILLDHDTDFALHLVFTLPHGSWWAIGEKWLDWSELRREEEVGGAGARICTNAHVGSFEWATRC